MLVAIGLWRVHFDLVSGRAPTPSRTQLWLYLHLPLVIAMAAVGAGLLNTVEHAIVPFPGDARWLLVGACAVAVGSVPALTRTLKARRSYPTLYRAVTGALAGSALAIVAVGFTDWGAEGTLIAMVLLLGVPIAAGLTVWVVHLDALELDE